jgi:prepilin-type N-terminal cleavage/methylation domain-containing protein
MKLSVMRDRRGRAPRRAFTLIELLVVIGIISILIALSAAAIFKTIGTQQAFDTRNMLQRENEALRQRWNATVDLAVRNSGNIGGQFPQQPGQASADLAIYQLAGGDTVRKKAVFISYYVKQQFPMSFAEVLDPSVTTPLTKAGQPNPLYNPLGPDPEYFRKLTTTYPVAFSATPQAGESAALLLMALDKGTNGPGKSADVFGASAVKNLAFPAKAGGNIDIPVLKDDWGTPLQFYRWSTTNANLQAVGSGSGSTPKALLNPFDPDRKLNDINWYNGSTAAKVGTVPQVQRPLFEASCYSLTDPQTNGPRTYVIAPVLASAGPDLKIGLDLMTMQVTSAGDESDNLYSYKIKRE